MIVFLLGIPGCGKSEFYRRLTAKLEDAGLFSEFPRVDDFPKLWAIFQQDEKSGKWERSRPTDDGGYKVTDDGVWDDILKEVNSDVMKMVDDGLGNSLLFIEFSRPDYVHSITGNFSHKLFTSATAVYLDVPFDICWQRNVRRHERALEAGTDDHLVSREEMEKTYGSDDGRELADRLPFSVVYIKNDTQDENDFTQLDDGVDRVFALIQGNGR
ncbi:MAG: hypothetical protein ABIH89_10725 [Elusimicrobiota bacterium]